MMIKNPFLSCLLFFFAWSGLNASDRQAIHLHLHGATAKHAPLVMVLEIEGESLTAVAIAEPYRTDYFRRNPSRNLHVDALPVDQLSWDGTTLKGSTRLEEAFYISLEVKREQHTLTGYYQWEDRRGDEPTTTSNEVHGMIVPVPDLTNADLLTLYLRNPLPGEPEGGRRNRFSRGIATISLENGEPTNTRFVLSNTIAGSRHTRQSFPVAFSGGGVGLQVVHDKEDQNLLSEPASFRNGNDWRLVLKHENEPVHYSLDLHIVGDLVFGTYRIEGDEDHGTQQVAGYLGRTGHLEYVLLPREDAPRLANELQTHLRWLMDVNAYAGGLFGNDMALGDLRNTGSKDYNDKPMVGAIGPMLARAVLATQEDPLQRARALMVGQRGGHYILSHRREPLNLLPTYKTMFRPQYWMGRALVDLTVISESEFWKARALEVADALRATQDEHGSWSYVDARTGEIGTTLSRGDRSWDNVPRANGMWLDLLGRIRTELGVEDYRDVEERAADWMRKSLLEGVTHQGRRYLIEGRQDGSRPDDDGPTFYALYQLRYADEWDQELFDATIAWAEMLWREGEDRLPRIFYSQPRDPSGMMAVGTMRMALIYALSAEKTGNADHLQKAGLLFNTMEHMYRPENGILWDSGVWDSEEVRTWYYHAYAIFPTEVAVNLIDFIEVAKRLEEAGTPIPVPQKISFPEIRDQPAEAALLDPGAQSDSGLSIRYEVDQGPAVVENGKLKLSGEPGIVWVTAYQDGTDKILPALSQQQTFAVGDALPPSPTSIRTRSLNNRAVEISWEPVETPNIIKYTIEESRDNGESWQQAGQVNEETHKHEVHGLSLGETRKFRVRSHNPSFASKPSEVVTGNAHRNNFHQEIDLANEVTVGEKWEFRPGAGPDDSGFFVPHANSRSREPNDDLSIFFTIDIGEQTGRYDVYYQCWGNAGSNDSAWIRTQADDQWHWLSIGNQEWTWRHRGLELEEPGKHTIYFGARQNANDGPRIARIIVTNTDTRKPPE